MNQRKLNLWSPLRSVQAEVLRTSWGLRSASVGSKPRSTGPRAVSAPLRSVQAEVPRTSWTLCARTVCPNQLEVVSLNSCKNKNTPSHMCEGVFLVVATRFELATSASRTITNDVSQCFCLFLKCSERSVKQRLYGT